MQPLDIYFYIIDLQSLNLFSNYVFELQEEPTKTELPSNNSAFLGPKIWKKPLNFYKLAGRATEPAEGSSNSINTQEAEFSVMNIDDFLTENNFDVGRVSPALSEELFGSKGVRQDTPFS